jgi:hypothetical protein
LSYSVVGLDMSVSSKMKFCVSGQARIARATDVGAASSCARKLRGRRSREASKEPAGQARAVVDDDEPGGAEGGAGVI